MVGCVGQDRAVMITRLGSGWFLMGKMRGRAALDSRRRRTDSSWLATSSTSAFSAAGRSPMRPRPRSRGNERAAVNPSSACGDRSSGLHAASPARPCLAAGSSGTPRGVGISADHRIRHLHQSQDPTAGTRAIHIDEALRLRRISLSPLPDERLQVDSRPCHPRQRRLV